MAERPSSGRRRWGAGFTLIEVLVALALLAIIVLGTTSLAVVVQDEFFKYSVRQKAVFAMHGMMQRLVSNYQTNPAGADWGWIDGTDYQATDLPQPAAGTSQFTTTGADIARMIPLAQINTKLGLDVMSTTSRAEFEAQPWRLFLLDLGAAGDDQDDRALMWLDPDRRLVASVSFALDHPAVVAGVPAVATPTNLPETTYGPAGCGNPPISDGTNGCALLIVYVEFPYVLAPTADNTTGLVELFDGYTETYTVATIVGPYLP